MIQVRGIQKGGDRIEKDQEKHHYGDGSGAYGWSKDHHYAEVKCEQALGFVESPLL